MSSTAISRSTPVRHPLRLLLLAIAIALPRPAVAQQQELAAIDSLIAVDEFTEARNRIAAWWREHAASAEHDPALRARALFLRARLQTDPQRARDDYLAVALGAPTAPEAPAALLYLAQGLVAAREYERAAGYLERLLRDYPNSRFRETARLWLVRVLRDAGKPTAACRIARQRGDLTRDPELDALFRAEETPACASAARGEPDKPFPTPPPEPATTAPTTPAAAPRYALQLGAFRADDGAKSLATRLRRAGYQPRIVFIPGSSLRRVRIGAYESAAAAEATLRKLRVAGFDVVLVDDADRERNAPSSSR